jgi:hypothetical protein
VGAVEKSVAEDSASLSGEKSAHTQITVHQLMAEVQLEAATNLAATQNDTSQ